jgi:threonine/homoserine/homoserine lactone efflux protein
VGPVEGTGAPTWPPDYPRLVPSMNTFELFAVAALAILLIPGPAVTYVVARSVDQGRAAGLASVGGLGLGTMVHVLAAAVGLSAILASSARAFEAVKLLGAAYLIFLGIRTILRRDEDPTTRPAPADGDGTLGRSFRQGVVVNVLNPKTALFFLAFLPQFVRAGHGPAWMQVAVLGTTFVLLGLCTDGTYAILGSSLGGWLRGHPRFERHRRFVTGGILVTLGVAAALAGSRPRSSA